MAMLSDHELLAYGFLQHLSDGDLALLASSEPTLAGRAEAVRTIRSRPEIVEDLLGRAETFDSVFAPQREPLFVASPFLIFAVALYRTRRELGEAAYVSEWLGPRQRVPIFEVGELREFLADPWRRLFLIELLASYTHVSSGSVLVPARRGLRRHRFSELDPVRLAGLLELVSEAERPGVYRRLGDLALFLTGVFPDHTATRGLSEIATSRLSRSAGLVGRDEHGIVGFSDTSTITLFESLGRRWYRLSYDLLPRPRPTGTRVLGELHDRFGAARRILNVMTDRYLFPLRSQWFGGSPS